MLREPLKRKPCESLSTDAKHSGGVMHGIEEAAVMAVERRYDFVRFKSEGQL